MQQVIRTVTVYGASSSQIENSYIHAAAELGALLAKQSITCINGAGGKGLMRAVSDSVMQGGGKAIGVIPQFMVDEGWAYSSLSEIIITPDMHTRKQLMAERSDACIALPGGVGTMEELLEIITWKQLGIYSKPVVILNTNGYYNDLLTMFEKARQECFIHHKHTAIWQVADTPEEAIRMVLEQQEWHVDPRSFAAL